MQANIKLGKILGIPVGLNMSWFLIFGLLTISLATSYFPAQNPEFPILSNIIIGVIASLLLFGSVLAHELGHAVIALRNNIKVRQINLFLLGGVAQIEEEPKSAGAEFRIAAAGPIVSISLAAVFGALSLLDQVVPAIAVPSLYLARANLLLAAFNMLPGFPLDGGRILRAAVWKFTDNRVKGTKFATVGGQIVAFGMIGFGLYSALLQSNIIGGMWFVFIGWYLRSAAVNSQAQSNLEQSLRGVTAAQVMNRDLFSVSNLISLRRVVNDYILAQGKNQFLVSNVDSALGYLSANEIFKIPKEKWPYMTTEQAMVPFDRIDGISPDTEINDVMRELQRTGKKSIVVKDHQNVLGAVSQDDIYRFIHLRAQFGT